MLRLFNSLGRKTEIFEPVKEDEVTVFTCGPSVYERAHIGNFRTFLFEDVLVRYLAFLGYVVRRGMNFTDVEDKAIAAAQERGLSVLELTDDNIETFLSDMDVLRMRRPEYLPRASEAVGEAVDIIEALLEKGTAYWHRGNVYFDPLKFKGFGRLYGLDMSKWPSARKRFHKDTYPGMRWNLGDFVLWHGYGEGAPLYWDTSIGRGRPSWNIEDPAMMSKHFDQTLTVYCGGIDNLVRHHDYTLAILESVRTYPVARYWLHCQHLHVNGRKMSKSRGNIHYVNEIMEDGYSAEDIRFFLIYGHYRKILDYSPGRMSETVSKLTALRQLVRVLGETAVDFQRADEGVFQELRRLFIDRMDDDLDVKGAFDEVCAFVAGMDAENSGPGRAAGVIKALKEINHVLQILF